MRWSERYVNPHLPIYSFTSHGLIIISCFVCKHLYSCFVEKFICTLCLDSTDKWYHIIYVFLFCLLFIEKLKSPRPQWHTRERLKHLPVRTKEPETQRLINTSATAAKSLQSCLTLCDPGDSSPPGSHVPGILQARTLEWVAISFSSAWKWKVKMKSLSRVQLFTTPWTAAYQAPPSMGFARQEYWSGLPLPFPFSI